jgi:hypothetical protein
MIAAAPGGSAGPAVRFASVELQETRMAVAIRTTDFPEGVGTQMYDGVQAEMDIANNPPEGLVFHWAGELDGKWTVMDVWETRAAYDRFRDERLFPAIRTVSGMDPADGPQPTITESEVHDYVKP